jgi:hypothetical protein
MSADSSSRMRSTSACSAACASRQALPSSTTTSGSMNSVWPLPDASWTMPLTRDFASARNGHDIAPVPERHDLLLERAAELRGDQGIEAAPEAIEGDAHGGAQPAEGAARRYRGARPRGRTIARAWT